LKEKMVGFGFTETSIAIRDMTTVSTAIKSAIIAMEGMFCIYIF
jgi:hypothetical protein